MNIPPSIGMLLSLVVGIAIGAYGMNARHDSAQIAADNNQINLDNNLGADITAETVKLKSNNKLPKTITVYRNKEIKVPRDLTDEEINTLCVNRNVPADILQLVRHQIAAARTRIDNMQHD